MANETKPMSSIPNQHSKPSVNSARISIPAREEMNSDSLMFLHGIEERLGMLPNLHRLLAKSPAVLSGWLALQNALATTINLRTREAIALAVSEVNECLYCLSAHGHVAATLGKSTEEEILLNRQGRSKNPKTAAAVYFAKRVVEARGHITDQELADVRSAGYTDAQIIEIVALAVQFLFTNFMNNVAGTVIDFPIAKSLSDQ
ncbi:MAG TPA: carboxymuconolactone decarboxylase family protein [Puia sp.]